MSRYSRDIQTILDFIHDAQASGRLGECLREMVAKSYQRNQAGHPPSMGEVEAIMHMLMLTYHARRDDDASIVADMERDPAGVKRLAKAYRKMKGGKR